MYWLVYSCQFLLLATAMVLKFPMEKNSINVHDQVTVGTLILQGGDGSILLKPTGNNAPENNGPPNIYLHVFYVIDNAKKAIESMCPSVLSCADILAFGARDAVAPGGPTLDIPNGKLDGRISKASETRFLPAPVFNFTQLK